MTCSKVISLLSRYIENELDGTRRRKVEAHLSLCVSCGRELETLAGALRVMRAVEGVTPPRDYSAILSQAETAGPEEGKKV